MILSIILGKLTPYEPQRRGNMLLSVNPGIVFISFIYIFPVVLSTEYIVAVLSPALEQIKLLPELVRHMSEAALLDLWSRLTVNIF